MNGKNLLVAAIIIGLLVIVGLGGYFFGIKSKVNGTETRAAQGESAPQASVPTDSAAMIDDLKAKLKEKPNDPELIAHLANAYFELKQFDQAVNYYKEAIKLSPENIDFYNEAGLSLHYIGKSADGMKFIETGISKNPYHQRIWLTKGFMLAYGMGDLDGARAAWEKAKALDPESQIGKAASEFLAQFNRK